MIKPNELENMMQQVKDPAVGVEEYNFLEDVVHGGSNGHKGLGNVGAHLAVYEENGEKKTDDELVEALDDLQAEHENVRYREKFDRITERLESQQQSGHRLLENMIEEFEINTISSKPENLNEQKGGERIMTSIEEMADNIEETVDEMYEMIDSLPGEEEYDDLRSDLDQLKDKAEAARDDYAEARGELDEAHDELETVYTSLESAHERVEEANEYVENAATATGHALEDAVSEMESALEEGSDRVDEAQGYMEEILEDDIPEMPDRPDRVEEQLS